MPTDTIAQPAALTLSVWDASGFLGMSRETLERVYGHHHPDFLRSAARALN